MDKKNTESIHNISNSPKNVILGFFGEGQDFFKNSLVHWILIATLFLVAASWAGLAFFIRPVDLPIVLHYNVFFGVDLIGDWWQAYSLPAVADIFFIINLILAYIFYRQKERIASYLFLLASLFVQAGILIAIGGIILMNY